ncbi:MAG: alpha/beta hydrolase [Acidobacteria bacterium]|nr:alpha/beta hydrolase [Acidobacteriota bacterium]
MRLLLCALVAAGLIAFAGPATAETRQTITIRGRQQTLRLYGPSEGEPVIVSSGDGGWIHLAPHVAELLAARGFFAIGFDTRAYLSSFTSRQSTLRAEEVPGDYRVLTALATRITGRKPLLIGVSEGAGLSVLAAANPDAKRELSGVIGLGLPDLNELGWRWQDMVTYLTHRLPDEPTFSVAAIIARVAPLPLAIIQATHDEFVPREEVERLFAAAGEPRRLWIVEASNHRFSDNLPVFDLRLIEAIAWTTAHAPHE